MVEDLENAHGKWIGEPIDDGTSFREYSSYSLECYERETKGEQLKFRDVPKSVYVTNLTALAGALAIATLKALDESNTPEDRLDWLSHAAGRFGMELELFAQRIGVDLLATVCDKFNRTSCKLGCNLRVYHKVD